MTGILFRLEEEGISSTMKRWT